MKKIKFGSFPLIELDPRERKCIDNYSIKSFADLITMNTQMRKTSNDIQQYITPDVILKYFKNNKILPSKELSNEDMKGKVFTLKRAYRSLQNFSKVIEGNAFYKDRVTYPIYIEHENRNGSNDYDFILLANDLIQKEILDEIKYDDTLSLTFLFIKDMLYPRIPLSKIGTSSKEGDSYSIRSDIAKFIEFSKSNNTDPISAMLQLIKIAGNTKKKQGDHYTGLKSLVFQNKAINQSISNKFFKLFGGDRKSGQIKDVNFLLNEIKHLDIADFFDDTTNANKFSHQAGVGASTTSQTSTIERQYMAQKTQDYNKILSMVDSLIHFNSSKDIMENVDTSIKDNALKLRDTKNGGELEVNINYDKMIGSLRNEYFEAFLVNLIQKLNSTQTKFLKDSKLFKADKKVESLGQSNAQDIEHYSLELQTVDRKINNLMYSNDGSTQEASHQIENLKVERNRLENMLKDLKTNAIFINQENYAAEVKAANDQKLMSTLSYNVETIQTELTGILHDIESALYDKNTVQNLFNLIGNRSGFTEDDLYELFKKENVVLYNIEQLTIAIFDSLQSTVIETSVIKSNNDSSIQSSNEADMKAVEFMKGKRDELEKYIHNIIKAQMYLMFKRLGRDYGDTSIIQAQQYADLRAEKNTVIRKTITNDENFKTYILNEDILLNLYKILNYVDTQKYISGLLAYPPAKINNELNIVKYVLKRLGLENNPVFIISKQSVILSQPDFLSLTGTSIFSKIPFRELENMCKINYNQLLWNNNQMFKQQNVNETKRKITDSNEQLKIIKDNLKMHKDQYTVQKAAYDAAIKSGDKKEINAAKIQMNAAARLHNSALKDFKSTHSTLSKAIDRKETSLPQGQEYGTSQYQQEHEYSKHSNKKLENIDKQHKPVGKQKSSNQKPYKKKW